MGGSSAAVCGDEADRSANASEEEKGLKLLYVIVYTGFQRYVVAIQRSSNASSFQIVKFGVSRSQW